MFEHRDLSPEERDKFAAVRMLASSQMPYLASTLFRIRVVATPGIGTFGIDRYWRLYIDPECLDIWGVQMSAAVLFHETGHILRGHAERYDNYGADDPQTWNIASDSEINDDLIESGIKLPEDVVTPESLGFPNGKVAELYYDLLKEEEARSNNPEAEDGESDNENSDNSSENDSCGSGSGGPSPVWELDGEDQQFYPLTSAEAEMNRKIAAKEILEYEINNPGSVSGGFSEWAKTEISPSPTPWQKVLAGALRSSIRFVAGAHDYTYSKRSRRSSSDFIFPGMHHPIPSIDIVVDTSGSVDSSGIEMATAEIKSISKRCGIDPSDIRILSVDASVAGMSTGRRLKRDGFQGGGGTNMGVGIRAAEMLKNPAACVVVLTDGYTPWPSEKGHSRLVIGLIGTKAAILAATAFSPPPEWAKVIEIPLEESS